ncbi:MAG: amidohydrolase family protein [Chitinophagales bacterium]
MKGILNFFILLFPIMVIAQQDSSTSFIVLEHVNVIDATGADVQSDMTVVINGNRIVSLEKTSNVSIPSNAVVINASGKYLIPGLWDMHVHVFNNVSKTPPDINDFTMYIANGVTGIREMWTQIDAMPQVNLWRKQINDGTSTIPRIGAVGTMVDGSPTQWKNSDTANSEAGARLIVQRIKAAGIDFVKVYNRLPRKAYFAIADECKKQHIPFVGHIPNRVLLKEAADAGQRSIEHLTGSRIIFDEDCASFVAEVNKELPDSIAANSPSVPIMEQVLALCDENKAFALYQYMANKNVWQCPTMTLYKRFATDTTKIFGDPRLRYISVSEKMLWKKQTGSRMKNPDSAYLKNVFAQVALMKKAGMQFLAGTDVDNDYLYPGFSLHDELALFANAGFTTMEALQTATINPAKFLGTIDSLGTIQKGKIADMVLLDANPLTDIRNTRLINAVFINGKYLSKDILQKMLAKIEEAVIKN